MTNSIATTPLTRTELIESLPEREREAYYKHKRAEGRPASPDLQGRMLKLYLMGKGVDEIQRTNKDFTLGMVVEAKIEGRWDDRKKIYTEELLNGVKDRVMQTQLEAIHFVSDQIGVAHIKFKEAMAKYLETGDENALGDMAIKNLKQYREALGFLMELTGQGATKKVEGEVKHTVVTESKPVIQAEVLPVKALPSSIDLLKSLEGDK